MSTDSISYPARTRARYTGRARLALSGERLRAIRPELLGLLGLAAVLNLWGLSINGWANTYYSAAVRSMSASWHNFLFASLDPSGLMTVDKPPLSLWIQALSARVFGFHPLSLLVPQAVMGVIAVGLAYDLVRRRFGRVAGFVGGLALATTPVAVAVSRHNNPDELLVLCCLAALWFAVRAFESGRTRWLVLSGIAVGLGFESKMGVALMVVPGIAVAWIWSLPPAPSHRPPAPSHRPPAPSHRPPTPSLPAPTRHRLAALRQLLAGGVAMAITGLAWPLLVTLTPAADRPWISGTSDNSIWSLIFGYNGLGRVAGQTGGPGGGGGGPGPGGPGNSLFGGATGPFRLLQSGLGDQAGWLLGFALVAGLSLIVLTRLRRRDARTGWLIAVGGAFLTTAVTFSFASGIFHPYYVSLLAPFAALLLGAGVGEMLPAPFGVATSVRSARIIAPLAIGAGAVTELIVLGNISPQLSWATPLVVGVALASAILLAIQLAPRIRAAVLAVAMLALLAAPAAWAAETIGHATNGTFPTGGPAGAGAFGGGGRFGAAGPGGLGRGLAPVARGPISGGQPGLQGGFAPPGAAPGGRGAVSGGFAPPGPGAGSGGPGPTSAGGGMFGGDGSELTAAAAYAKAHGGGTIGVSSQSSAAAAILSSDATVAGLGGFSGRESSVSAAWISSEVQAGRLRWVLADATGGGRLPGDTRTGSRSAVAVVEKSCKSVTFSSRNGSNVTMYDCLGRASAIRSAANTQR